MKPVVDWQQRLCCQVTPRPSITSTERWHTPPVPFVSRELHEHVHPIVDEQVAKVGSAGVPHLCLLATARDELQRVGLLGDGHLRAGGRAGNVGHA